MNVIRVIVNKFFELRKNNDDISLRDFYSIYKTALLELEVTECKVSVANNSYHSCYSCMKNIPNMNTYLNNHTLTLFNVLLFLWKISPKKREKKYLKKIYNTVELRYPHFYFINVYFQHLVILDRINEITSNGDHVDINLINFRDKFIGSFKNLENVSLEMSFRHFFKEHCKISQMKIYKSSYDNPGRTKEINKEFRDYWNITFSNYVIFLVSNTQIENNLKIFNDNFTSITSSISIIAHINKQANKNRNHF
jgi:hypothetical protein